VVLFGATGMVGHGILTALLEDPSVTRTSPPSQGVGETGLHGKPGRSSLDSRLILGGLGVHLAAVPGAGRRSRTRWAG